MSTKLQATQRYHGTCDQVRQMLTDPQFVAFRAERTGAIRSNSEVTVASDGIETVTSSRTLPADVPNYATRFIGETLTVDETQVWPAATGDGSCTVSVHVQFSAPITFSGRMFLRPDGDECVIDIEGEFKAGIPLIGGKVEELAKAQTERYLAKEQRLGVTWLTEHP